MLIAYTHIIPAYLDFAYVGRYSWVQYIIDAA